MCLRINELHCPNINVVDEGQEADIDRIDLPDLIDRNSVELDDDDDDDDSFRHLVMHRHNHRHRT